MGPFQLSRRLSRLHGIPLVLPVLRFWERGTPALRLRLQHSPQGHKARGTSVTRDSPTQGEDGKSLTSCVSP